MLGYIIAIRNLAIAVILSWIGISFSAPDHDTPKAPDAPEETVQIAPETLFKLG